MESNNKKNICRDCRYYNTLYVKYFFKFERQKIGFCSKNKKFVQKCDVCELYKNRLPNNKTITIEHIDDVISDVEELMNMLKEI